MDEDDRKRRRPWDDVFGGFDEEFEEMRRRMERMMNQLMQGMLSDTEPMVYGFTMRTGPDGRPRIQEFGNTSPRQTIEPSKREPLTDIIEEADKIRVIVELPGVEKSDIRLNANEETLDIDVDDPERRYSKHVRLPAEVNPDSAKARYKNGVLEVTLSKINPRPGREIQIE